ncbi:hypothetical protein VNI00_019337, partial [Paramarasmius palmivorus]
MKQDRTSTAQDLILTSHAQSPLMWSPWHLYQRSIKPFDKPSDYAADELDEEALKQAAADILNLHLDPSLPESAQIQLTSLYWLSTKKRRG